ncbi:MAG: dihydrolipoyl dehydrogenase [Bacillota bacterium]
MAYDYDIIIIGGGPGGYFAAIRASQLGARTVLIEKSMLGGTCLNKGCIPTKSLLASAQKLDMMKDAQNFGIYAENITFDLARIMKRKNDIITRLRNGINFLLRKNNIKIYQNTASFIDEHTIAVGDERISGEKFIIASGAVPQRVPFADNSGKVVSSDQIMSLTQVPQRMSIVGAGVMGIEFACIWQSLGSQVTLIEIADRILPFVDREIAAQLGKILQKRGINIISKTKVDRVEANGDAANLHLIGQNGEQRTIAADIVLASTGRTPYFAGLGLDNIGIEYTKKGIVVDDKLLTNKKHIAAIGDVLGGVQLAHLASAQGLAAAEHLCGAKAEGNLHIIPACIYSNPEIASVGLNEDQAKEQGLAYQSSVFPLAACGKAVLMGESEGLIKIISAADGKILGIHILGPHASDMIGEAALAMSQNLSVSAIANTIHPHPSVVESLMEAAHLAEGNPIHVVK